MVVNQQARKSSDPIRESHLILDQKHNLLFNRKVRLLQIT